jgi:hypothetical protein
MQIILDVWTLCIYMLLDVWYLYYIYIIRLSFLSETKYRLCFLSENKYRMRFELETEYIFLSRSDRWADVSVPVTALAPVATRGWLWLGSNGRSHTNWDSGRDKKLTPLKYLHKVLLELLQTSVNLLIKGLEKLECETVSYCESNYHVKGWCPLYKIASKLHAIPCGYAVPGLGFYYIPNNATVKAKLDVNKVAEFQVSDGLMGYSLHHKL